MLARAPRPPYLDAMTKDTDDLSRLDDLVARAKRAGAAAAAATLTEAISVSVSRRLGALEGVERSEGRDLGLRVFVGRRNAHVSSTDLGACAQADMV